MSRSHCNRRPQGAATARGGDGGSGDGSSSDGGVGSGGNGTADGNATAGGKDTPAVTVTMLVAGLALLAAVRRR